MDYLVDSWNFTMLLEEAPPPPPEGDVLVDSVDFTMLLKEIPPAPPEAEKKFPWIPAVLIGSGAVLAGSALMKSKKKGS